MELLAPASDLKKLRYAFHFGADAVYCGVPDFSLRGDRVNKFIIDDLAVGIKYAHSIKKKVYLTLNIYPHNAQIKKLTSHLKKIAKLKPDALIVSDPGVINVVRKRFPCLELHLSTQANCINYQAVQFWKKQGIKRIILAREVSLDEIKEIKEKVKGIELEYFCHGAMCMSYSGRCLLSSWINARSSNEGECTQPCRWPWGSKLRTKKDKFVYEIQIKETRNKNVIGREPVEMVIQEINGETYIFNSKDLCLIEYLSDLEKAGINCLKIEGRNKSLYYLVTVVKYYKQVLMSKGKQRLELTREALKEFAKLGNRQYTTGFLLGMDSKIHNYADSRNISKYEMVGEIAEETIENTRKLGELSSIKIENKKRKSHLYPILVHNAIYVSAKLEVIEVSNLKSVKVKKIFNHKKEEKKSAHGGTDKVWYIGFNKKLDGKFVLRGKKLVG
jgi:putative protease